MLNSWKNSLGWLDRNIIPVLISGGLFAGAGIGGSLLVAKHNLGAEIDEKRLEQRILHREEEICNGSFSNETSRRILEGEACLVAERSGCRVFTGPTFNAAAPKTARHPGF